MSDTDLRGLGSDVALPDQEQTARAREWAWHADVGRLGDTVTWLAGTRGMFPITAPGRRTWVHVGEGDVVDCPGYVTFERLDTDGGFAAGVAAADRIVDSGTDLLLVSGRPTDACPLVVAILTEVEPVAVMPRGPAAVDTEAWIAQVTHVRDRRRELMALRDQPDVLLEALDDAPLAAAAGLIAQAAVRRTPMLLEGQLAVAAALLAHETQPRFAEWWRLADSSTSLLQRHALDRLDQVPLTDNGIERSDGTAALVGLVQCYAAALASAQRGDRHESPPPAAEPAAEPPADE